MKRKNKNKSIYTGKTYTEEEVNELKKQWVEENRANIMAIKIMKVTY